MPDSPLFRYSQGPAGVGWWDQPLSQDTADRLAQQHEQTRLARLANARGQLLEEINRKVPDLDWNAFYQEHGDAFRNEP